MNPAHLHLAINHAPLIGTAFTLLLLVVALAKKSEELKRISLCFLVLMALLSVPAYLTGEPAEEIVEKMSGISHAVIEEHEESAQWAFGGQIGLGVLALVGLVVARMRQRLPNWIAGGLLVLALIVGGMMARTANLGGLIRHPEIQGRPASGSSDADDNQH